MKTVDKIKMIPLSEVKPYDNNPRHNNKTVDLLVQIIPKVGFNVPLVLDKDNVIVKGHARFLAAKQLDMSEVPCVYTDADPEAIRADRIADNKIFEFSQWINEELMHEVDMLDLDFDVASFGLPMLDTQPLFFDDSDFDDIDDEVSEEERRQKFAEFMAQQEAEEISTPIIATQADIDRAKQKQKTVASVDTEYYQVECEKCGHTMFVRNGDEEVWQ